MTADDIINKVDVSNNNNYIIIDDFDKMLQSLIKVQYGMAVSISLDSIPSKIISLGSRTQRLPQVCSKHFIKAHRHLYALEKC